MKITEPDPELLSAATRGDMASLDRLLRLLQPSIFNLACRMLGHREDAADATQEILLRIVTHLGSFRGDAAFSTWVWRIARNHLLTASTRSAESPEVSLEAMAEKLQDGLAFADAVALGRGGATPLTPQDKLEARQVALGCTQNMLMSLGREQRLAYVLDAIFALSSEEAAAVLEISAQAYRQRLARARGRLDAFTGKTCGLVSPQAPCRCERQLPALRHIGRLSAPDPQGVEDHRAQAEQALDAFARVSDAAALFRSLPQFQAPERLTLAIRAVLTQEGFMQPRHLQ